MTTHKQDKISVLYFIVSHRLTMLIIRNDHTFDDELVLFWVRSNKLCTNISSVKCTWMSQTYSGSYANFILRCYDWTIVKPSLLFGCTEHFLRSFSYSHQTIVNIGYFDFLSEYWWKFNFLTILLLCNLLILNSSIIIDHWIMVDV